jgi:two-component system, chemotaxis family, CheB/CheR fusion protein
VPLRDTSGRITGWFGTATDVQDLKDAQEALRLSHEELETRVEERTSELAKRNSELRRAEKERLRLLRQLVNAEEAERRRIARELHDHMGQQIAALLLGLKAIQDVSHGRTQALERIEKMQGIVKNLDQEVDRLSLELRPATLDDLGLAMALEQHLADWSNQTNVPVSLNIRGLEERLPLEIETTLYRVIQEAMTNIIKHAAATTVSVVIERRRNEVRAVIEDDGQGFDLKTIQRRPDNQRNIGLSSMRERVSLWGGKFNIESAPGKGTSIFVRMPLEELDDAA